MLPLRRRHHRTVFFESVDLVLDDVAVAHTVSPKIVYLIQEKPVSCERSDNRARRERTLPIRTARRRWLRRVLILRCTHMSVLSGNLSSIDTAERSRVTSHYSPYCS